MLIAESWYMAHQPQSDARSLYHRWRSRSFSEVVAQDHVTRTLKNAVAGGKIVHAYLFCGPRGTGKTSTARILAKAVNCLDPQAGEPCNRCASCVTVNEGRAIDLIEIDAASNRGIDDARELREKIKFSPAEARYKVYIIDEAHMLTSEASNALLKTLEEPPEHAILILATTEAHKILPTISSRCQRFDFRRIPLQAIAEQLSMICEREGLKVEPGVLDRVGRMARGSLRDAESLLDQLVAYCVDDIGLDAAREVLGLTGEEALQEFAEALRGGDVARGFRLIDQAASTGSDLRHFSRELVDYLRALMVAKSGADTSLVREFRPEELARLRSEAAGWGYQSLLAAIRTFGDMEGRMRQEPFNQLHLEIAFMEAVVGTADQGEARPAPRESAGMPAQGPAAAPSSAAGPQVEPEATRVGRSDASPAAAAGEAAAEAAPSAGMEGSGDADAGMAAEPGTHLEEPRGPQQLGLAALREEWTAIVQGLGGSAALVLAGCRPLQVSGDAVVLGFEKPSWRERVERLGVGVKLEESLSGLFGRKITVQFKYGVKLNQVTSPERDAVVDTAMREFGFKLSRVEPISD